MDKLKKVEIYTLNEAYNKVMYWFFSYPNLAVSLSELSTTLKISKTTANQVVLILKDEGFLNIKEIGRIWQISCNRNHIYNYSKKISFNLMMIYESGILSEIHKLIPSSSAVVLFGSYRKGDDTEKSDIDIAIEVLDGKEPKIINLGILPQLGYRKDVPVNLYIFSRNNVDLNLFSNVANGIVLEGFLEVRV
ncbi:MAG: nucleotidyltransferase domain-containing protein [Candidatus Woesearchaeota archaeon]|jgi:predicted nucleotidyltransferase